MFQIRTLIQGYICFLSCIYSELWNRYNVRILSIGNQENTAMNTEKCSKKERNMFVCSRWIYYIFRYYFRHCYLSIGWLFWHRPYSYLFTNYYHSRSKISTIFSKEIISEFPQIQNFEKNLGGMFPLYYMRSDVHSTFLDHIIMCDPWR